MKIKLIVEDLYGGPFLIDVIQRLKDANLVNKNLIIPKPKHLPADCNQKLDEILEYIDNKVDRIIIVLAEYEIEEWICISKDLKWKHSKPSEELKRKYGYEKYKLPKYANELDFNKLKKNCKSFKAFLNALIP